MRFLSSRFFLGAAVTAAVLVSPAAHAQTIDFESTPDGLFTSYTESGVTFTAVDGGTLTSTDLGPAPNGTRGLLGSDAPYSEIRASISGGASFVSIDLGDYNSDEDTFFLEAFNTNNTSIGFTSQFVPSTFTGMNTLSLSASDIASVVFGARAPAVLGSTAYADNFTFRPAASAAAAPEPGSLGFLLPILGTVSLVIRRRKK